MLKFFRRIRQKLISQGNVRRYLLYAIGEIALVMIGILLALQVNNWNNKRIERKQEQNIFQRLVQDLEKDVVGFSTSTSNFEKRLLYGIEALEQLGSLNIDQVKAWEVYQQAEANFPNFVASENTPFGQILFGILRIDLFKKTDITFQELVSNGKIDVISDKALKEEIQKHYSSIDQWQNFQDQIIFTVQGKYRNALERSKISYLNRQSYEALVEAGINQEDLKSAIENFLSLTRAALRSNANRARTEQLIKKIKQKIK